VCTIPFIAETDILPPAFGYQSGRLLELARGV
jgi:hypothetical protein